MVDLHQVMPDETVLEHACRGLPVDSSSPIVDAAAELGELHATRHTDIRSRCDTDRQRQRLIGRIDVLVAALAPPPRPGARAHTESVGAVIDQIASCCAIAFRAPLSRVSPAEIADVQAQLRGLCGEYSDLIDEVAAGICLLPTNTLPNAGPSGIDVLSKRER